MGTCSSRSVPTRILGYDSLSMQNVDCLGYPLELAPELVLCMFSSECGEGSDLSRQREINDFVR